MEIRELYDNLNKAYTEENLSRISGRIIELFREHRFDSLRAIQKVVSEYTPCKEEQSNRIFSRLIMLYHPDKLSEMRKKVDAAYGRGDFEELYSLSHILSVQNLDPEKVALSSVLTDEDLAEEFGWDGAEGYSYFTAGETYTGQEEEGEVEEDTDSFAGPSFLSVLKRRVYGNMNVDFPMYLLEDLEEIEMADYDLEFLDGISACRHARAIDLSNNVLTDINELGELRQVERLYLANNNIGLVDALGNLRVLQVLDLSFNDVDDLSPLFELNHLSYLNVMGNRIPAWQLEKLQLKGITVVA